MRRAASGKRRDENEPAIVNALRAVGATVEQLSGPNLPDLLVGFRGFNWLMEVKGEKERLRYGQSKWHLTWAGHAKTVFNPDDALCCIGAAARMKVS